VRTALGLADVVRRFGNLLASSDSFTSLHGKVLGRIATCRTAALGGHEQACDQCGTVRYSYNSCGDRHCPTCQASKQAFWIDDLVRSTLPVKHYHLVFTVPHQLNGLCLHNGKLYYDTLFEAVWHTLRTFGYTQSRRGDGSPVRAAHLGAEPFAASAPALPRAGSRLLPFGRLEEHRASRALPLSGAATISCLQGCLSGTHQAGVGQAWRIGVVQPDYSASLHRQLGGTLRTFTGFTRPCGALHGTVHPSGSHHQSAHTAYCRRQSHLHGQRLPTIRDQATRDPGRRGVSATLYTPHTPASLCQDTPFRHLQSHPQAKSLAQVCA